MRGEDTRAYAKRAGISENTVKFHLKSAFRATGTRRQSELVQLATATLRDLS
jgi:DNA-binding CsgD family transcriptional regulator